MRVRYVVEHGTADDVKRGLPVALAEVDADGEYMVGPTSFASIDAAKAAGEAEQPDVTWKDAPKEWQPDTILVSNYWNDEGWDNR